MSESSIQANWPAPEAPLSEHKLHLVKGIEAIHDALIVPEDGRFETAYTLLSSGRGQKSSVLAKGDPASGKTSFGDLMFGVQERVEIDRTDTEADLYGYQNPIKPEQTVEGKLKGLRSENPTAYLNEASHLRDTGPIHRLWDASEIEAHGQVVPMEAVAIYLTSNFPDGSPRVKEFDAAFRSRITMELLTGDGNLETAKQIQGYNAVKSKNGTASPILPTAAVRKSIAEKVAERYPVHESTTKTGDYVVDLVTKLNATNLLTPINPADARTGEALHDTARAIMWLQGAEEGTAVTPYYIARAGALVLPTVADLSPIAKSKLMETAGRRATYLEQAVAIRRIIARTAFRTLLEEQMETEAAIKDKAEVAVAKYSYANAEIVPFDIDQALYGGKPATKVREEEKARGLRILGFRRSS